MLPYHVCFLGFRETKTTKNQYFQNERAKTFLGYVKSKIYNINERGCMCNMLL